MYPANIILIDIGPWPYYEDNRDEARQARNTVVKEMTGIIGLLNRNLGGEPPFIGIDMTFDSSADDQIMHQLLAQVKTSRNIFLGVQWDRYKREIKFPRNYFWNGLTKDKPGIKKRLLVVNLEKYAKEPVRRYKTYYQSAFDNTGTVSKFPAMGTVIAAMVKKYYLGDTRTLNAPDRVARFRFRYLVRDIETDFRRYHVLSLQKARRWLEKAGGEADVSSAVVIFGRMDPDPNGRDRYPVCAYMHEDGREKEAPLPGVLIHINAAQSILLGEDIKPMPMWQVMIYLIVLLTALIFLHHKAETAVSRWKPNLSHWFADIFLFFALGLFIVLLDYLSITPGNAGLEIPVFTFYMFVLKFYPSLGLFRWVHEFVVSKYGRRH